MLNTVASLLIESEDRAGELLMGIRSPEVSFRHPNVLSTITQRIPRSTVEWLGLTVPMNGPGGQLLKQARGHTLTPDAMAVSIGGTGDREPLNLIVEAMLARKIGAASLLELGKLSGVARVCALTLDVVADPMGSGISEETLMVTIKVILKSGANLLPSQSTAYSRIAWVNLDKLWEAVRNHDALMLLEDVDPFAICLHGLCVRSAATVLAEGREIGAGDR